MCLSYIVGKDGKYEHNTKEISDMNRRIFRKKAKQEAERRRKYEAAFDKSEARIRNEMKRTVEGFGWPIERLTHATTEEWDALYELARNTLRQKGETVVSCPPWFKYSDQK